MAFFNLRKDENDWLEQEAQRITEESVKGFYFGRFLIVSFYFSFFVLFKNSKSI
jgi:hypothetical protein